MSKVKAVRNISNRPLSYVFNDGSVTVFPKQISDYYPEEEWENSLAQSQLNKNVADKEARVLTKDVVERRETKVAKATATKERSDD